jgi:hypothetical protein
MTEFVPHQLVAASMGAVSDGRGEVATLIHAVELGYDCSPARVLCGRAKPEHILGDQIMFNAKAVDCAACLKRMRKLGVTIEVRK